jgi:hypothetical protein
MPLIQSKDRSALTILSDEEEQLVKEATDWLESVNSEESRLVQYRFRCLKSLGEAVALYPSARDIQLLRGIFRDGDQLVDSLCAFSSFSARLLHIPTRVVAFRSLLVAKFHAFSLFSMLTRGQDLFFHRLRSIAFSVVCTLMAEEVYISCLEDPSFPRSVKNSLADDLVSLWDSGTDLRATRHLPALTALWIARESAPPTFGTMNGTSEVLRITMDLEKDWRDFLVGEAANEETKWALEEFLFGLSYEEIQKVRSRLIRFGISAVNSDEIRSYLGSKPAFSIVKDAEPRTIYDFFVERREAANFRKRVSLPGPRHTLEGLYLIYRILLDQK